MAKPSPDTKRPRQIWGWVAALGGMRLHEDVAILLDWGLVERTDDRKIVVPYGVIHADFDIRAAA